MSKPFGDLPAAVGTALATSVTAIVPVGGGSINQAWRMSLADGRSVFVKTHPGGLPAMFEREAEGLDWLRQTATVQVPRVLAVEDRPTAKVQFLALEWIEPGRPAVDHDEVLGRSLADLHRFGAPLFGLDHDNYIGELTQGNEPADDWPTFYGRRRLDPLVRLAIDRHRLPVGSLGRFERLYDRLPALVGPPEPPARLHGDLWSGNAVVGSDGGPWLIDPAVYGGHREVDLAMMRLFGGFGARCFEAYQDRFPLAEGHEDRVGLYQLYPLLVHVLHFGGGYVDSLLHTLSRYVDQPSAGPTRSMATGRDRSRHSTSEPS
jgi:fructosamine-3-kinase